MKNNFGSVAPQRHWLLQCLLAVAIFTIGAGVPAQPAPTSPAPATANPAPDQPSATEPAPIPLAEVATDAEGASARLRDVLTELSSDPITEDVAQQLPLLTREIDARLRESRKIVAQRPSLEILIGIEAEWRRLRRNLAGWTQDLMNRATRLEREIAQLDELRKIWGQPLDTAKNSLLKFDHRGLNSYQNTDFATGAFILFSADPTQIGGQLQIPRQIMSG